MGEIWTHLGVMWAIRVDVCRHIRRVRDHPGVQGGPREGYVLQILCFNVILIHLEKPQDEARNFEEDSMRAQGVLWEGHVLK